MDKEKIKKIKEIACVETYRDGTSSSSFHNTVCPTLVNKIMTTKRVPSFYKQERDTNFKNYKKKKCSICKAIDKIVGSV